MSGIEQIKRVFGNLDADVLQSVLDMCGGDSRKAVQFLQAQDGGGYDPTQLLNNSNTDNIPSDYPLDVHRKILTKSKDTHPFDLLVEELKKLFIQDNVSLKQHFDAQNTNYEAYTSVLLFLIKQGVEIKMSSRSRVLAACWARKDRQLADHLMKIENVFTLPAVLSALNLLDAARKVRAIEKRIARLEKQGTCKPKKITELKAQITELTTREIQIGSVSGALARTIRKWAKNIPKDKLEFFALTLPKEPWRQMADMIHFAPKDFQVDWFLSFVFDQPAPEDSIISVCKDLESKSLPQLLEKHQIPYSYLRINMKNLADDCKTIIANYSPLDTVIWYYEELACKNVDQILSKRLDTEEPTFGYGKLMERLLFFQSINAPFFEKLIPCAQKRLDQLDLQLESPVVVLGDASYSMDVAIRTSTIFCSVLTALCGAELKFFTSKCVEPPLVPKTVTEVLKVASTVKADGLTAPAAALWHYYKTRIVVKFFIVVTDEIENEKFQGFYFPSLFMKYYEEVYPAKIVFVSFLQNPSEKGRMVKSLENMGIEPLQFKLDGRRPDLTKLDSLLGLLASESASFPKIVGDISFSFKSGGFSSMISALATKKEKESPSTPTITQKELKVKLPENTSKHLKEEEEEEEVEVTKKEITRSSCIICEEKPSNTALLECGHMNFCPECATDLKECPICRNPVVRTLRVYH